jgi:hypothetical protein
VARIDDLLERALKTLPAKPADSAKSSDKKGYSEAVSAVVAQAFAEELRYRGLKEARPAPPGELGDSGAERRMAGGIGAKKVDVTWATEESGLLFAISIKSINFRDKKSQNFQKNLTNRRGDMLFEAVTLHRRFPYAVLAGFFFLDKDAKMDGTLTSDGSVKRRSTFLNAHSRFKMFTGRDDPAGRDEQYERFYLLLIDASPSKVNVRAFKVGEPDTPVLLANVVDELLTLVAERNPDFYECVDGQLVRASP